MLRGPNGRPRYTVGMDEISAPIRIRIFVFSCCATRIGAATDRERIAQQRKRPLTEAASFIFQRTSSVTRIAASRPFPMNCAINTSTRSSVWPETMYRVKKIPRRAAITAAITAVALSDILSPHATLFLRRREHIAHRICLLLLTLRQSAHRELICVVGLRMVGHFLLIAPICVIV